MQVVPFAHRGHPAICKILDSKLSGELEFTFQHQKFVIHGPGKLEELKIGELIQLMNLQEQDLEPDVIETERKNAKKNGRKQWTYLSTHAYS